MTKISRRRLLRGVGGATLALPPLASLLGGKAWAAEAPRKRLLIVYFSNGVTPEKYWPTSAGGTLALSPVLSPFEPIKSKLTVLRGVHMETARANPGNTHNVGMTNLLTARKFQDPVNVEGGDPEGWGSGISIDQHIGKSLNAGTRFPSLQIGVQANRQYAGRGLSYLSYSGPRAPTQSEDDPRKVFDRVFSTGNTDAATKAKLLARKQRILDFVRDDLVAVKRKVGRDDNLKLENHLQTVVELEERSREMGGLLAACTTPSAPASGMKLSGDDLHPSLSTLMSDLIVAAFSCDATRVITLQYATGQSGVWPKFVGNFPSWHHDLSHRVDADALAGLVRFQTWYMQQVANIAKKLDAIADEGATILENSIVLTVSEQSVGNTHSFKDMPFVLVGGAGGQLKGNRMLTFTDRPHNDLFVSIAQSMGLKDTTFGAQEFNKGPLSGVFSS